MSWIEIAPDGQAEEMRRRLLWAFTDAWSANVERFRPEELGDTSMTFGLAVTINARHLAAVEVRAIAGVEDREHGNLRWLEVERDGVVHRVYVYKAPPAAASVEDVSFSDSKIKEQLTSANTVQMALGLDGSAGTITGAANIVIVMFGDSVTGFERAVVGAPYLHLERVAGGVRKHIKWSWSEPFGDADHGGRLPRTPTGPAPTTSDDDLPVRLRPVAPAEETG
ncbi:hypothetical protein AB0L40_05400 [Patulibacter sp. NPDC049589]|uniref:hypothetical protein n=1 Tax=Patulibacter sp. NPDC049589 TaxID=3154731 RepID=UPI003413957B